MTTEINRDPYRILSMILDIRKIYTKYFNQVKKANSQCNKIKTYTLGLEQDFCISNKEREQAITLPQEKVKKLKRYKKMIDTL